jgi:hypothetical protein
MADHSTELSPVACARIAGFLYLIIIVCGLFGEVGVRANLIVPGDATATAGNIMASASLVRLGLASDLIAFVSDVAVAVLFYVLLRPVSKTLALVAAAFRLTGTAIYGVNLLNYLAAALVLNGDGYLNALEPGQLHALALFFLEIHKHGYDLGLVFFGVHCLVLGYLLYRSEFFPRVLGVLMVLAAMGYLIGSLTLFLFPSQVDAVAPVYVASLIGEVSLCAWLLVQGVRIAPPRPEVMDANLGGTKAE